MLRSLSQRVVDLFGHPGGTATEPMARVLNFVNRTGNQRVGETLGLRPGDRVLEVGFGGGAAIGPTLAQVGPNGVLIAADLSADMAIRARRVFARQTAAGVLHLICADVAALPLTDESVDHAYAMHSHLYWPSPLDGIRELRRVLRPGGRLLLGMDTMSAVQLIRWFGPRYTPAPPAQLVNLLRDGALAPVTIRRLTATVVGVIGQRS